MMLQAVLGLMLAAPLDISENRTLAGNGTVGEPLTNCNGYSDCSSCASTKSWNGDHCRWCPRTNDCHAYGSTYNKCSTEQQIDDASKCAALNVPEQIHIALAGANSQGDATGMTVSWFTGGRVADSVVQYGTSPTNLSSTAKATIPAYQYLSGYNHHVELPNLELATKHWYRVGSGVDAEWSTVYSFKSAPNSEAAFTASVFGDMGYLSSDARPLSKIVPKVQGLVGKWDAVRTRTRLETLKDSDALDLVFHLGDISYADDAFVHDLDSFLYDQCYNGWMQWMQNITATRPYMVAVGNHEVECHSPACRIGTQSEDGKALANFTAFNARWLMPSQSSGGALNMWYSFNYGAAHFVSLNTETDFSGAAEETKGNTFAAGGFGKAGEYLAWLEADLKRADDARRTKAPGYRRWIVVGGHRPCSKLFPEMCDAGEAIDCNCGSIEDLLLKYNVDLAVFGHEHFYTRTLSPANTTSPTDVYPGKGTMLNVVVGGAGCEEMAIGSRVDPAAPGAMTYQSQEISTGLLTVNTTTLQWRLVASSDGAVLDEITLTR